MQINFTPEYLDLVTLDAIALKDRNVMWSPTAHCLQKVQPDTTVEGNDFLNTLKVAVQDSLVYVIQYENKKPEELSVDGKEVKATDTMVTLSQKRFVDAQNHSTLGEWCAIGSAINTALKERVAIASAHIIADKDTTTRCEALVNKLNSVSSDVTIIGTLADESLRTDTKWREVFTRNGFEPHLHKDASDQCYFVKRNQSLWNQITELFTPLKKAHTYYTVQYQFPENAQTTKDLPAIKLTMKLSKELNEPSWKAVGFFGFTTIALLACKILKVGIANMTISTALVATSFALTALSLAVFIAHKKAYVVYQKQIR